MQKNITRLLILLFMLFIPTAYADAQYVVLTPGAGNSSYDGSFNNTAISINNSLANNSVVVYFDDTDVASINTTIASYNPEYLFLVIRPQNATPQLLDSVGDMLKTLDSDPFIDVAWGVITGKDNTSAWDLYGRSMSWSKKKYFVVPYGDLAIKNANFLYSRLISNREKYINNTATSSNIYNIFSGAPDSDLFYYSTNNITDYNQYSSYNNDKCFIANTTELALWCLGETNLPDSSMSNTFVVSDTPESGRVSGKPSVSNWYFGKNTTAKYDQSFLINTIDLGASAVFAPYSDVWATHELLSKNVVNEVLSSSKLGVASKTAKNIVLLNLEKEKNIFDKTFLENLEKQYLFYGNPELDGDTNNVLYTISTPTPLSSGSNHIVGENITWNMTIIITPTYAGSIYTNSWQQSSGSVWYKNITSIDSENKTNITILGALSGVVFLDESIYNKTLLSTTAYIKNKTVITLRINQTNTIYIKNETIQTDTFISGVNDNEVYFSILYSPNETLTALDVKTLNLTIQTSGVTQNSTEVSTTIQNTTVDVSLNNPTPWVVSNVTVVSEVPINVTTGCVVSGLNVGVCNIIMNDSKQFANFTISSLETSINNYNLIYMTAVYANTTIINPIGNITDRGDTLTYNANISTTLQNNSFADINITLYAPDGNISWQNITSNVNINKTNHFVFQRVWVIPFNATPGQYRIEINAIDNVTKKGIYNNNTYFDVTNQLEFYVGNVTNTVNIAPIKHTDGTDWYFMEDDDVQFSGFLRDMNGNNITGTVNATIEGIGQDNSTTFGLSGFSVKFNWSGVALGTHNLTITAVDNKNNTATYRQPIYISNYVNKTTVTVAGHTSNVYEYNKENVTITVTAMDSNGSKVYLGDVTLTGSAGTKTTKTDINGIATFKFPAPKDYNLDFSITASSPLNKSSAAKITNSSFGTYYSTWIYYEPDPVNITPSSPKVGQDITLSGKAYFKGNKTSCTSGKVTIIVNRGAYSRNKTNDTISSNAFVHEFLYTSDNSLASKVNFQSGTWSYTLDGYLNDCKLNGRTFATITSDDPTTATGTFTVSANSTTPSSETTTSTTDTTSSDNSETCTKNSDCSSGDYCSTKKLCKPISCTDGIILNHECISAYKITLSDYPKTISIEQGKSDKFNLKIKNTGYKNLTELKASFVIPATSNFTNWYVLGNISKTLETDKDTQTEAILTVSENAIIQAYPFNIKIVSKEKTHEETMTLQVLPGDKEKIIINKSLENLSIEINILKEELDELFLKLNNSNLISAKTKLTNIELLHERAKEAILNGDYLTAYNQEKDIKSLLAQVTVLLDDSKLIAEKSKTQKSVILFAAIIIILIAGIFYYLWVPAPGYESSNGTLPLNNVKSTSKIETKSPTNYLTKLKLRMNELIDEYVKNKEKEANAPPQYDFHKKKKWA